MNNTSYITSMPYRNGTFTGELKNEVPYNGTVENIDLGYKGKFSGLIKDGAISENSPRRHEVGKDKPTSFQRSLLENDKTKAHNGSYTKNLSSKDKFDITNDSSRRVYETYYSKYALENLLIDKETFDKLYLFSRSLTEFYKREILDPEQVKDFEDMLSSKYKGKNVYYQQFMILVENFNNLFQTLDIDMEVRQKLKEMYCAIPILKSLAT